MKALQSFKHAMGSLYYPALSATVIAPFLMCSLVQQRRLNRQKRIISSALVNGVNQVFDDLFEDSSNIVRRIETHNYRFACTNLLTEKKTRIYDLIANMNVKPSNDIFYPLYSSIFPVTSTLDIEVSFASDNTLTELRMKGLCCLSCVRREADNIQKSELFKDVRTSLVAAKCNNLIVNHRAYETVSGLTSRFLSKFVNYPNAKNILVAAILPGRVFLRYAISDKKSMEEEVAAAAEIARVMIDDVLEYHPNGEATIKALETAGRLVEKNIAKILAEKKAEEMEEARKARISEMEKQLKDKSLPQSERNKITKELEKESRIITQRNLRSLSSQLPGMGNPFGTAKKNLSKMMKM